MRLLLMSLLCSAFLITGAPDIIRAELTTPPQPPAGYTFRDHKTYKPENLHLYINGRAEQFVQLGFKSLSSVHYDGKDNANVSLDVYEMNDALGALGCYLDLGAGLKDELQIGFPSCSDPYGLAMLKGRYFIQISTSTREDQSGQALNKLLAETSGKLPDEPLPVELGYLPSEGLVSESLRYTSTGVLRMEELPVGFSAQYYVGGAEFDFGLAIFDSVEKAMDSFKALEKKFQETPSTKEPLELSDDWLAFSHRYRRKMLIVHHGRFVIIAFKLNEFASGITLVDSVIQRLPSS